MKVEEVALEDVKKVIQIFNSSEIAKSNGVEITIEKKKKAELIEALATSVENTPDDQVSKLPQEVVDFYMTYINPQEEQSSAPPEEKPTMPEKDKKPVMKEEKKMEKLVPKAKKEVKPEVKTAVKKPVAKKEAPTPKKSVAAPKKEVAKKLVKPVAKKAAPSQKKEKKVIEKDVFGYKKGSQANIIDEKILSGGATIKDMAKACKSTESRVRNHLYTLAKVKGFNIVSKDGVYSYKKGVKK